jgi:VanZ family protein
MSQNTHRQQAGVAARFAACSDVPMLDPRRLLRSIARWYAVVAMLGLIFALSSLPNVAEPRRPVIPLDKLAHFGEYAVLAFVCAGSLRRQARGRFVPGRDPALSDWLADLTGSTAGALASAALLRARDLRDG